MHPPESEQEVLARVQRVWDLSGEQPEHRPGLIKCPACRASDIQQRHTRFFLRRHKMDPEQHASPYRCDVSFKCRVCSMVWLHGVVVPKDMCLAGIDRQTSKARPLTQKEMRALPREEVEEFFKAVERRERRKIHGF